MQDAPSLKRASAMYENQDEDFKLQKKNYDRQYSQLYFYRLVKMRPIVEKAAERRWKDGVKIVRIIDIPEEGEVVLIGTLFKEMPLKPSILDEYTKDRGLAQHLGRTRFTSPDDKVVLEDEGARVALFGDGLPPSTCVTGVVAAVRGSLLPNGSFEVKGACFSGIPIQMKNNDSMDEETDADKYVAFVSGIGLTSDDDSSSNMLRLQLLTDYLTGALGGEEEHKKASKIVRLVVAGGLIRGNEAMSQPTAYSQVRDQALALAPVREADMKITELAAALPVDVMPGPTDPANYALPQQPLHRCLFPGASRFKDLNRCTNPHKFKLDNLSFLGTSGQNVDDIARYSDMDDRVKILECMLLWRHMIPTSPDTLATYPYYDNDPFIVDQAPDVFFAGGQPSFGTSVVEGEDGQKVRVVAIPDFSKTGTLVLMNLRTLEAEPIDFEDLLTE